MSDQQGPGRSEFDLLGIEGVVRASYHTAIRFGSWRLQTIGPAHRVLCHVLHVNQAWLAFTPLSARFRLTTGGWWSFPIEGVIAFEVEDNARIGTFYVTGDPEIVRGG